MYAENFEYDNELLSDYGYIVCDFDGSSGFKNVSRGSSINFKLVPTHNGIKSTKTGYEYDGTVTMKFGICKNPDVFGFDNRYFTEAEERHLIRWLERPDFKLFRFIHDENDREPCYFDCNFNVEVVKHREKVAGFEVTMNSNSAYGHALPRQFIYTMERYQSVLIPDVSDVVGESYVDMKIELLDSGSFVWKNEATGSHVQVLNCTAGEELYFYRDGLIIESSNLAHDKELGKDFNFDYPKLRNDYNNIINKVTVDLACKMTISYTPFINVISA